MEFAYLSIEQDDENDETNIGLYGHVAYVPREQGEESPYDPVEIACPFPAQDLGDFENMAKGYAEHLGIDLHDNR